MAGHGLQGTGENWQAAMNLMDFLADLCHGQADQFRAELTQRNLQQLAESVAVAHEANPDEGAA